MLEDLDRLLQAVLTGSVWTLPNKTHSTQTWSDAIDTYGCEKALEHLDYWHSVLENAEDSLDADYPSNDDRIAVCNTLVRELSERETSRLLGEANTAFRTQTSDLLIASLAMAVSEITGKNKITIELEGHGREELFENMDVSRTIGWFTSLYPVNLQMTETTTAGIIKSIKGQLRSIPNKGIDYGILAYGSGCIPKTGCNLLRFNYMGEIDNHLHSPVLAIAGDDTGRDTCPSNRLSCLVDVVAMITDKRLQVRMTYSKAMFSRDTMDAFIQVFMQRLAEVIQLGSDRGQTDFTPSDFETVKLAQEELDVLFNS